MCILNYGSIIEESELTAYVAREVLGSFKRLKWNEYPNGSRLG